MIADVDFLAVPVIRGMKEIPVFFTSAIESVIVHTAEDVKVTEDIVQSFTIPSFTGWGDCNMVRINSNIYWATMRTDIHRKESLIVNIEYCGIASQYDEHSRMEAVWSRLPFDTGPTEIIPGSVMKRTSITKFGTLGNIMQTVSTHGTQPFAVFWVEITADKHIKMELDDLGRPIPVEYDHICRYGAFIAYNAEYNAICQVGGGTIDPTHHPDAHYPTLDDLMNWKGFNTGTEQSPHIMLSPSSIKDINISRRCPYKYVRSGDDYYPAGSRLALMLPYAGGGERALLDLTSFPDYMPESDPETVTVTASDPSLESLTLVGEQGETVCAFDWNYGTFNSSAGTHTLTATVKCRSDITGIYTDVTINNMRYVMPEGKLSWNSSAWDEYRAYSMNYDRGVAALNAEQARTELTLNKVSEGAGNAILGALAGGAGGPIPAIAGALIGAGASLATGLMGQDITYNYSIREQELKEKMVKAQPGNLFNQGYGNAYLEQSALEGAGFIISTASNISAAQATRYHTKFGYPAVGYRNTTINDGYHQGVPFITGSGPKDERLANELMNGVNIKLIRGQT